MGLAPSVRNGRSFQCDHYLSTLGATRPTVVPNYNPKLFLHKIVVQEFVTTVRSVTTEMSRNGNPCHPPHRSSKEELIVLRKKTMHRSSKEDNENSSFFERRQWELIVLRKKTMRTHRSSMSEDNENSSFFERRRSVTFTANVTKQKPPATKIPDTKTSGRHQNSESLE